VLGVRVNDCVGVTAAAGVVVRANIAKALNTIAILINTVSNFLLLGLYIIKNLQL
jgi:hypothetical protein